MTLGPLIAIQGLSDSAQISKRISLHRVAFLLPLFQFQCSVLFIPLGTSKVQEHYLRARASEIKVIVKPNIRELHDDRPGGERQGTRNLNACFYR
jgi:hypothetical protein